MRGGRRVMSGGESPRFPVAEGVEARGVLGESGYYSWRQMAFEMLFGVLWQVDGPHG